MAQIIQIGIVINVDPGGHPNMAQVRVPNIHGLPISRTDSIIGNNPYKQRLFEYCSYTKDESNSQFTIDNDLPWWPICYSFGSKIGPAVGDIVYIILEGTSGLNGLIVGWSGNQICYQDTLSSYSDKTKETATKLDDLFIEGAKLISNNLDNW